MKWNTKKKNDSSLQRKHKKKNVFLSGIRLRMRREVKYLGVQITDEVISDSKLVDL